MSSQDVPRHSFGRYQVLEELGAGAMGVVYLCVDPSLARPVAIKVLKESEYLTPVERDQYHQRFRQEAEAAGRLSHPDIVQIYDIGPSYLVMEFVEGRTLRASIESGAPSSVQEHLRVVQRVADALAHAHRHGIVHRDIKPANIMVLADGGVKVMDFGVARLDSSNLTAIGTVLGSVRYMAPEQMMGQRVDGRADVFSLAAVAYELLTGRSPFPGKTATEVVSRVMHGGHVPPREVDPRFPERLDAVFAHALAPEAERRCGQAPEFAGALRDALRDVGQLEIRPGSAGREVVAPTRMLEPTAVDAQDETRILTAAETPLAADPDSGPRPSPGVLSLDSRPPGARASLDGIDVGATPIAMLPVSFGWHQVRLVAPGHETFAIETEVDAGRPLVSLSAELDPLPPAATEFVAGMSAPVRIAGDLPRQPAGSSAGCPEVELLVAEDGSVARARVLRTAGALLDEALLAAVGSWRFSPALRAGEPQAVRLIVRHAFRAG